MNQGVLFLWQDKFHVKLSPDPGPRDDSAVPVCLSISDIFFLKPAAQSIFLHLVSF